VDDRQAMEPSSPIADLIAGMPEVWHPLLAAHVADELGRCSACRSSSGAGERWPCSLHEIAEQARQLYWVRMGQVAAAPVAGD
jgi:hypothetical protein